jgi:hypothetical protein
MPDIPSDAIISIPFTVPEVVDRKRGNYVPSFTDTLFIPAGEYRKLSWDDIEKRKDERYNAWLDAILNPAPASAPDPVSTSDALSQARDALTAALDAVSQAVDQQPEG